MHNSRDSNITKVKYSNELCHYGILGQKWGVRRYQYEDGSLTEEGREHYGYKTARRNTADRYISDKNANGYNVRAKDVKVNMDKMSDAELQKALNRLNMQQQINSFDKSMIDIGLDKVKKIIKVVGTINAASVIVKKGAKVATKILTKI